MTRHTVFDDIKEDFQRHFTLHGVTPNDVMPEPTVIPYDVDTEDILAAENIHFMKTMAPTLTYLLVLIVVGVLGNSVVLVVYYRQYKPSSTRTFVLALALCDLLISAVTLPIDMVEIRFSFTFTAAWACKLNRTVRCLLVVLSACILVAVALDRQRSICRMQRPSALSGYRPGRVYGLLVLSAVVASVMTAPYFVLVGRQTKAAEGTNVTGVTCSVEDRYRHSRFYFVYQVVLSVSFVVCVVVMTVSYGRIGLHLWRHKKHTAFLAGASASGTAESSLGSPRHNKHTGCTKDSRDNQDNTTRVNHDTRTHTTTFSMDHGERCKLLPKTPVSRISSPRPSPSPLGESGHVGSGHPSAAGTVSDPCQKIPSRTTYMLFVLTVIFVLNYLPYLAVVTAKALIPDVVDRSMNINLRFICTRSFYVNCAINWIVYSLCSARFRQECRRLFSRKTARRRDVKF